MAIAVDGSTQAIIKTAVSSTTIAKPAGTVSGSLLVMIVMVEADAGKSAFSSTGFVQEGSWASPNPTNVATPVIGVFVKTAGGSEPSTYTVNGDGTNYSYAFTLMAVSGADNTTAVSVGPTSAATTTAATALVAPSVTPTVTGALLVCAVSQEGSSAVTYSTPAGMTVAQEFEATTAYTRGGVYYQVLASAAATGTRTSTSSSSLRWSACSFTINPTSATNYTQTVTDTAGAADSITRASVAVQTFGDTAGATDSVTQASAAAQTFGDTAGAADSVTQAAAAIQAITDTAGATDSITVRRSFSALVDNFATKDTARWYWNGGADVTVGQVVIPPTASYGVATVAAQEVFDLTGSAVTVESVARMGGSGSGETYMTLTDWAGNAVLFSLPPPDQPGWWTSPKYEIGGIQTPIGGGPFDHVAPLFLRIREAGGTIYWDSSPDGAAWTNVASVATPIDITAVHLELGVGDWGGGTPTTPAIFDNVNVAPSPDVSTLTEDFATQDTAKWTYGPNATASGGQLVLTPTLAYDGTITSTGRYDLRESEVVAELVATATGGTVESYVHIHPDTSGDSVLYYVSAGGISAFRQVGGGTWIQFGTGVTYDPVAHRWLRIREAGGTLYWDTSPDGQTWTPHTSWTHTWPVDQIRVALEAGYFGTTASGTTVFDNVNLPPTGTAYTQTITDTAGAADSTTVAHGWGVAGTDTAGAADSVTQALGAARSVTDPAGAVDSANQALSAPRTVTDTAGAVDSVTVAQGWAAVGTDTAGATDSVTQATAHVRTLTDTAGATDSTAAVQGHARIVTDTAGAVDSTSAVAGTGVTITDSIGVADGLTVAGAGGFSHDDAAGVDDSLSQTVASARAVTDTAGATDSVIAAQGWPRTVDDAAGATDSISTAVTGSRPITDPAGAADSLSQAVDHVRTLTDSAGAADSTGQAAGLARTVTDTAGAADTLSQTSGIGYSQTITDTAGAADSITRASSAVQTVTDSAGAVDSTTAARLIVVVLSDSAGAHDSMTSQSGGGSTQKSGFLRFLL